MEVNYGQKMEEIHWPILHISLPKTSIQSLINKISFGQKKKNISARKHMTEVKKKIYIEKYCCE